jgi:hypothetical protein
MFALLALVSCGEKGVPSYEPAIFAIAKWAPEAPIEAKSIARSCYRESGALLVRESGNPVVASVNSGLGAIGGPCLGVDIADVAVHRVQANYELVGDLLVAVSRSKQA